MAIPLQEQIRQFDLRTAIGLPPETIIYRHPEEELDHTFFASDEFRTRLVLKEDPKKYDTQLLYYLFSLSQDIDDGINNTADSYPHIKDPVEVGKFRELVRLHTPELMQQIQKNFISMLKTSGEKIREKSIELWRRIAGFSAK